MPYNHVNLKKQELILNDPINYKRVVSETFQKIICNKGFNFDGKEQKILDVLHTFSRENQFKMQFPIIVQLLSEYGYCIPILDKTKGGHIMLTLAEPQFINKVEKLFINPFSAIVYRKENIDDTSWLTRMHYTDKYVETLTFGFNKNNEMTLENIQQEVPKEWQIAYFDKKSGKQYHRLGCLPVGIIYNKPYFLTGYNAITQTMVQEQTDIWNARGAFELSNQILVQTYKELIFNRTRLAGNLTQTAMNKLKHNSDFNDMLGDFIIEATPENGTSGTRNIEFLQGNPQLQNYVAAYNETFKTAMRAVGISESEVDNGTQKTTGEISMILNNTTETLKLRRLILSEQLMINIFDKVLIIAGIEPFDEKGDRKYNFDIVGTDMLDETNLTNILIQQIEAGLADREYAIGRLRNYNSHEAENALKEIDTHQKRDLESMSALLGDKEEGGKNGTSTSNNKS